MATQKGTLLFPHIKDAEKPILKVNNAHSRAPNASGVKPFRLYNLRHTWATRAAEAGLDRVTLVAMLGHAEINRVLRYAHPTAGQQANATRKIEDFVAGRQIAEYERIDKQPLQVSLHLDRRYIERR